MDYIKITVTVLLFIVLTACRAPVPRYIDVEQHDAVEVITKNEMDLLLLATPYCQSPQEWRDIGSPKKSFHHRFRLIKAPPNQLMTIKAKYFGGGASCRPVVAQFTPEKGKQYFVRGLYNYGDCTLVIEEIVADTTEGIPLNKLSIDISNPLRRTKTLVTQVRRSVDIHYLDESTMCSASAESVKDRQKENVL